MERKENLDAFGVTALLGMTLLLGFNQVLIKVTNDGLQPVFYAGLRSLGAIFCLLLWMRFRGRPLVFTAATVRAGILVGLVFAAEFIFLFLALDLTSVVRCTVIFYSMPVWLSLMAHFFLPGDRIGPVKAVGLALAFAGVAWAIIDRDPGHGEASLLGDIFALGGALGWAGTALLSRATALNTLRAEMQLFWMVLVSAPALLLLTPFFGPLIRDLQPIHLWALAFQIVVVVSFGFVFWLWLLSIYPASGVASFGFLTPILGVGLGWLVLGEPLTSGVVIPMLMVVAGIALINRPARSR